ncbi:hypothetical protein LshimejAT787_0104960 [Lyophyllum shimeji]|uniref:CHAT domain-containing protein n=1 Tax=Lyophyllum shimeji TaxID=47721 RepID=A0A9P3UI17_LYOSH|nr:hypothetical protein LshimejAT787_0104960 [Lyophyllum shimeji]
MSTIVLNTGTDRRCAISLSMVCGAQLSMAPPEDTLIGTAITCLHRDDFVGLCELLPSLNQEQAFSRLALVFKQCHVDLMLKEAVQASKEVWDASLRKRPIKTYGVEDVYASCMYYMIQELGRKLLEGDAWETEESPAKLPLQQLRQHVIERRRADELMFLFRAERSLYSLEEMVSNLTEALSTSPARSRSSEDKELQNFRTSLHIALARALCELDRIEEFRVHVELARASSTALGDHNQCMWVRYLAVLCKEYGDPSEKIEELEHIALQFSRMKDRRGFLTCKMAIARHHQKQQQSVEYHSAVISAFHGTINVLTVSGQQSSSADTNSYQIGSALLFWQYYMGMMPHDMRHFQFLGTALELGTKFFEVHPRCSIPEMRFALSSDLSALYGQNLGDTTNEIKWAAKAVTHAKETGDHEAILEAETRFRIILSKRNIRPGGDRYGFYLTGWRETQKRDLEIEYQEAGQKERWEDQFAFANKLFMLQLSEQLQEGTLITGEPWLSRTKHVLERLPDNDLRSARDMAMDMSIAGTIFESRDVERAAGMLEQIIQNDDNTRDPSLRQKAYFLLGRARLEMYRETKNQCHLDESRRLLDVVAQETLREGQPDMSACSSRALYHIQEAESLWNAERDGIWNLGGLDGLLTRFSLRERNEGGPIDVFAIAYDACFAIGDHTIAWKWAQKAKARGFIHALGVHSERNFAADRQLLTPEATTIISDQLQGKGADFEWLPERGDDVVLIDWVTAGETIYLLGVRPGNPPVMHKLEIGLSTVEEWYSDLVKSNDNLSDADEARETLSELAALCKPLESHEVARPGDLLVLCPTKVLSKIPLHALEVDGDVLLARNPVVYTHALPVLRECFWRVDKRNENPTEGKHALFGNPRGDSPGGESSVRRMGAAMHAETFVRGDATRARFLAACQSSKFIHYHGHVAPLPQGHAMKFADSALGVADIFATNIRRYSPFVSIVGCGSGSEKVRLGDEPLGLVSAFIYAGASTVLATLWPINDTLSGEPFSRYLFDQFVAGTGPQLNLARALQEAALKLRVQKDTQAPYYWAGYVLHGRWMFKL